MTKRALKQLDLQLKKEEHRKHIADLTVELMMSSFERRSKLFSDSKKVWNFTETVVKVRNPLLWTEFKEFWQGRSEFAIAVSVAVGRQESFEQ